jgi:uncharacterized membrane protein
MNVLRRIAMCYALTALCFLAADGVWLTAMTDRLYRPALGPHLAARPDLAAALAFYALYFVGVTVFAIRPWRRDDWRLGALLRGALFGVVAYGTYDLTNQATLSGWPWSLTVIDMIWGGFATGAASWIVRWAVDRIG